MKQLLLELKVGISLLNVSNPPSLSKCNTELLKEQKAADPANSTEWANNEAKLYPDKLYVPSRNIRFGPDKIRIVIGGSISLSSSSKNEPPLQFNKGS